MSILEEAISVTSGDRRRDYGTAQEIHGKIARFWQVYLGNRKEPSGEISAEDVASMMILLKIARNIETPKRDNLVDIAGYANCSAEILNL